VTYTADSKSDLRLDDVVGVLPIDERVKDLDRFRREPASFGAARDRVLQWLKTNCANIVVSSSSSSESSTLSQCTTLLHRARDQCFARHAQQLDAQHERHQRNLRRTQLKQERVKV
jgi:predicted dinucleotide-utilizing enzyme